MDVGSSDICLLFINFFSLDQSNDLESSSSINLFYIKSCIVFYLGALWHQLRRGGKSNSFPIKLEIFVVTKGKSPNIFRRSMKISENPTMPPNITPLIVYCCLELLILFFIFISFSCYYNEMKMKNQICNYKF